MGMIKLKRMDKIEKGDCLKLKSALKNIPAIYSIGLLVGELFDYDQEKSLEAVLRPNNLTEGSQNV